MKVMAKINIPTKKVLLAALLVILIVGAALGLYFNKTDTNRSNAGQGASEAVNYSPPTEEEKQQADDNKSRLDNDQKTSVTRTAEGKVSVKPVITYAGQQNGKIEVGSYVPGIFEDGGTCTATFSKDSRKVSRDVNGVKEGNSTFCPMFNVSASDLQEKGSWTVVVYYNSPNSSGNSDTTTFEVK
jgi:hypothetical protein